MEVIIDFLSCFTVIHYYHTRSSFICVSLPTKYRCNLKGDFFGKWRNNAVAVDTDTSRTQSGGRAPGLDLVLVTETPPSVPTREATGHGVLCIFSQSSSIHSFAIYASKAWCIPCLAKLSQLHLEWLSHACMLVNGYVVNYVPCPCSLPIGCFVHVHNTVYPVSTQALHVMNALLLSRQGYTSSCVSLHDS